jgi:hypothetical protein
VTAVFALLSLRLSQEVALAARVTPMEPPEEFVPVTKRDPPGALTVKDESATDTVFTSGEPPQTKE